MTVRFLFTMRGLALLAACVCAPAPAQDWSVSPLDYRVGTPLRGPFDPNDVHKNIFALTHPNGYKYGSSYFSISLQPVSNLHGRDPDEVQQMLSATWAVPVSARWAFEGFASIFRSLEDARSDSGPDSSLGMQLMFDASAAMGYRKNVFRIGIEYQYWNSKPSNAWGLTNGQWSRANTPMLRAEYHFR